MLPLNAVSNNGVLNNPDQLMNNLKQVKSGNVDGYVALTTHLTLKDHDRCLVGNRRATASRIQLDCISKLVIPISSSLNLSTYLQLAEMASKVGLKMQVVMSFRIRTVVEQFQPFTCRSMRNQCWRCLLHHPPSMGTQRWSEQPYVGLGGRSHCFCSRHILQRSAIRYEWV